MKRHRRALLQGLLAAGACTLVDPLRALFGAGGSPATTPGVDVHSHAWRRADFGADLRRSGLNLVVMVASADRLLQNRYSGRLRALGSAPPGALDANTREQLAAIEQAIGREQLIQVRSPADVARAQLVATPGILLGCEGADMLEGSLERLEGYFAAGVRLLQLVHYRVNELADIQTEDAVHGGLTRFGVEAVRACNRLGIVVDVAHATQEATRQVANVATQPLLLSHTFLREAPRRFTRGISREHALAVAATGGVIGVVPFPGVFPTLEDYCVGIARMVEVVGVDHVAVGGDLAGIPGAPPYRRFEQFPALLEFLRERGFGAADVAKIGGGNFMRLYAAVAKSS